MFQEKDISKCVTIPQEIKKISYIEIETIVYLRLRQSVSTVYTFSHPKLVCKLFFQYKSRPTGSSSLKGNIIWFCCVHLFTALSISLPPLHSCFSFSFFPYFLPLSSTSLCPLMFLSVVIVFRSVILLFLFFCFPI